MLRTDRGGEFISNEFTQYCKENGITRQLTAPYSPQQNGVVERRNRTIMSTTRCMMKATNMPQNFWAEAIRHAIYILNSVPTKALEGDLIITGTPKKEIDKFKAQMGEKFEMSDLGLLAYYLGIEVTQTDGDISIKQSAYANKILKEAGMLDCNETLILMDPRTRLTKSFHARTKRATYEGYKTVLRYIKGTKDYGITYMHNEGNKIHGFSDSSYGVNTQEGKGTTGIIFYYATAAATQALWLKRPLNKLTHSQEEKVTIKVDNKSAIALMKNPVFHERSKHIDTKYHFIREYVEREDIQVKFISYQPPTTLMKARLSEEVVLEKCMQENCLTLNQRRKAWLLLTRLVAKGYTQTPGIDYEETFSPVTDIRAIRILIAIAAYYDYEIWQMNVKTAFLNRYLNEEENLKLSKSQCASTPAELKRMQNVPYASAVGSIMYDVRCTRPGVVLAQNVTSRFQQNLSDLKQELRVSCYTDAGYLTDADDLKSQTGYVFVLNGGDKAVWVRKFISGLGVVPIIKEPISMYCDNTEGIAIANESGITKGAKHFRAKVRYLREVIEFGDIKLEKVHIDDNLADLFTLVIWIIGIVRQFYFLMNKDTSMRVLLHKTDVSVGYIR
nr:ribonuclease H-like domain, reverse transcriptase, RNA-dependent DNA polymerase [Tanacetum cinerariifolium]